MRDAFGGRRHRPMLVLLPITVAAFTSTLIIPASAQGPTGYVEVCKQAGSSYVSGTFSFTVQDAAGSHPTGPVLVGQCTAPIQVEAGNVTVTETPRAGFTVKAITTDPQGRVISRNKPAGSAVVSVPAGNSSNETRVSFFNAAITGKIKVCKTLAANSAALENKTFTYSINSAAGYASLSVVAGAVGTTACKVYTKDLPIGSLATVTEHGQNNVENTSVIVDPPSNDWGSAVPTARIKVSTGTSTATFTNQALGTLEVCKAPADVQTAPETFSLRVNGGAWFDLPAGQCTEPITVPAGLATIEEAAKVDFVLVSVTANNRLVSGPTDNPATVVVPYGGPNVNGNETVVTFTNRVAKGQFKLCKKSSEQSLKNTSFHFDYSYTVEGETTNGAVNLKPGQCSLYTDAIPVIDSSGQHVTAQVTETQLPTVDVGSIVVTGPGNLVSSNLATGEATINLDDEDGGHTVVTYTNVREPV